MKRLHSKNYMLTKRGLAITQQVEVFIEELVRTCMDVDPIDLHHVISRAIGSPLARHYIDSVEYLDKKGRKRRPWRKNP